MVGYISIESACTEKKKKKKDEHEEVQAIKEAACSLTKKSGSLMLFSKDDPP